MTVAPRPAWTPAEWGPSSTAVASHWGVTELEVVRSARLYAMSRAEADEQERLMLAHQPKPRGGRR